ncbi:MAG: S41 family peptidase [Prevotella sp.]|nr:S41 family peptidase [Prevotella sp.]
MRPFLHLYILFLLPPFLVSCVDVEEYDNTCRDNTEALWRIMDERYCFFTEKKEQLGVDWDDVHARYAANVNNDMSRSQLFVFLGNMLGELRDGHVNLSASFDVARNWSWKESYAANYSDTLQRRYLGTDYKIASGMYYRILDDNIGYVYIGSFSDAIGDGNIDEVLLYLAPCRGLIVDVRNNGGGMLTEARRLAARFCNQSTHVGYMRHKTGSDHDDFSEMEEQWIAPSAGIRWQKNACVLTNRSVYSAANEFVKYMKQMPRVTIVGDITGGGSGMPYSSELPNGWSVRLSACPMYDVNAASTEHGIVPDVPVSITDEDMAKSIDTIIETARTLLSE